MPAWEGRGLELKARSVPPLPDKFCSAICRSKLSSQNPFDLRVFDCGEYGLENQSDADRITFFWSHGIDEIYEKIPYFRWT